MEAGEKKYRELLAERSTHVWLLIEAFRCVRSSAKTARLGKLSASTLVMHCKGNVALGLNELADKLEGLHGKM